MLVEGEELKIRESGTEVEQAVGFISWVDRLSGPGEVSVVIVETMWWISSGVQSRSEAR